MVSIALDSVINVILACVGFLWNGLDPSLFVDLNFAGRICGVYKFYVDVAAVAVDIGNKQTVNAFGEI